MILVMKHHEQAQQQSIIPIEYNKDMNKGTVSFFV